jgi:hypothetical protein
VNYPSSPISCQGACAPPQTIHRRGRKNKERREEKVEAYQSSFFSAISAHSAVNRQARKDRTETKPENPAAAPVFCHLGRR